MAHGVSRYNGYYFPQRIDLSPPPSECSCHQAPGEKQDGQAGEHHRIHGALQNGDHRLLTQNICFVPNFDVSFQ